MHQGTGSVDRAVVRCQAVSRCLAAHLFGPMYTKCHPSTLPNRPRASLTLRASLREAHNGWRGLFVRWGCHQAGPGGSNLQASACLRRRNPLRVVLACSHCCSCAQRPNTTRGSKHSRSCHLNSVLPSALHNPHTTTGSIHHHHRRSGQCHLRYKKLVRGSSRRGSLRRRIQIRHTGRTPCDRWQNHFQ